LSATFVHHRIDAAPRRWQAVADRLAGDGARRVVEAGGQLYGAWRSQIGRPRDEIAAVTGWSEPVTASRAQEILLDGVPDVLAVSSQAMTATLRPADTRPPLRQGNYAFRWFVTPEKDWPEFLDLCAQAWPGFEAAYDSQVVGLWRCTGDRSGPAIDELEGSAGSTDIRSLLLTRRPDLAMWERSKLPQGAAETAVRDALSRRYDLCTWTVVHTTTLLTASDTADQARWA
jgi:hypothetical protein